VDDRDGEMCITFSLPKDCPSKEPLQCSGMDENDQSHNEGEVTPDKYLVNHNDFANSSVHFKRKFSKAPMVASEGVKG
jgi:hypothetical protein